MSDTATQPHVEESARAGATPSARQGALDMRHAFNTAALALYRALGFAPWDSDTLFRR